MIGLNAPVTVTPSLREKNRVQDSKSIPSGYNVMSNIEKTVTVGVLDATDAIVLHSYI